MGRRSVLTPKKWTLFVATVCAVSVTFSGCASAEHTDGELATPDAVSDEGAALYSAAQHVIGVDGWSLQKQWFSCGLEDGVAEVQLRLDSQLTATLSDTPENLAMRVQEKWSTLGVDATLTVNTELDPTRYIVSDPPFLAGTHKDGAITDLWVGTGLANFGYVSPCVPGDIFELQPLRTFSPAPTVTPPSSP